MHANFQQLENFTKNFFVYFFLNISLSPFFMGGVSFIGVRMIAHPMSTSLHYYNRFYSLCIDINIY